MNEPWEEMGMNKMNDKTAQIWDLLHPYIASEDGPDYDEKNMEILCADDLPKVWDLVRSIEADNAALREQVEGLAEALEKIVQWSDAYPLDVFPEPDFEKAHELLKSGGMTLDGISASNMRHVVEGVGEIAKTALAVEEKHEQHHK